jgi:hypothetical protein
MILRVIVKAGLMFAALNLLFAVLDPIAFVNRVTLYNLIVPGRARLPYGENPSESYNVTLTHIDAMLASHELTGSDKPADEFRVLLLGDSATWGWLLQPDQTVSACLNQQDLRTESGRRMRAYNLGYPVLDATKDLLILDAALEYEPDMVLWFVTLAALYPNEQLFHQVVRDNPGRVRELAAEYDLSLDLDSLPDAPGFWERSIIGRRHNLADWLRHQVYGVAWAITGIDHRNPRVFMPVQENLRGGTALFDGTDQQEWTRDDLSFDVLAAGRDLAGDVPLVFVNEPIYISEGVNSDLRYNFYYPRWAYDQYRDLLNETGWETVDLWDAVPRQDFTDSSLHITAQATCPFAAQIAEVIVTHE